MRKRAPQNVDSTKSEKSTQDRVWDLWAEVLLEHETNLLLQQIEEEKASGTNPDMMAFFAERDNKYRNLILRGAARQKRVEFMRTGLPRLLRAAAVILVVLTLSGSIALATSPFFRVQVMRLLATVTPQYTRIELVEDEASSFLVPREWKGTHYLSYIPEKMELSKIVSGDGHHVVEYAHGAQDKTLFFSEDRAATVTSIDTENATQEEVLLHGKVATVVTKGAVVTYYWIDGNHVFLLMGEEIDRLTMDRIASGVRAIK